MNTKKRYAALTIAAMFVLLISSPVLAANKREGGNRDQMMRNRPAMAQGLRARGMMQPGVAGTVTAINGNTITIQGRQGFGMGRQSNQNNATTTYSIDATNAKVIKNNATSSVSSIAVGDIIMAQGTISGTNVTATMIRDGVMRRSGNPGTNNNGQPRPSQSPLPIQGNGQPVIAGTISAINGSSLTVSNKSNVTYTVDASNAKIVQGQNTISVSNLAVNDAVVIQGTVSGSSVTASSIIDQTRPGTATTTPNGAHPGFFGQIGGFFRKLFGF